MSSRSCSTRGGASLRAALLLLVTCVSALLLPACGGGESEPDSRSAGTALQNPSGRSDLLASLAPARKGPNQIVITAKPGSGSGQVNVSLTLPGGAEARSLQVKLNGKPLTSRFGSCSASCEATLSAADGIDAAKNVLSATVKVAAGGSASGRLRFAGAAPLREKPAARAGGVRAFAAAAGAGAQADAVAVCDPVNMCPPWLPPSVTFQLTNAAYWINVPFDAYKAMFNVNGRALPTANDAYNTPANGCDFNNPGNQHYFVQVLDRRSLNGQQFLCFLSGASLTQYLKTLTISQLVVVLSRSMGNDLDTSSVGGTNFANVLPLPATYFLIGSGGQAMGTAYEYRSANPGDALAIGTLQEDPNGYYNFQSSDVVHFAAQPQDPTQNAAVTFSHNVPNNLGSGNDGFWEGESRRTFVANTPGPSANGLWLLKLWRNTLVPVLGSQGACSDGTWQGPNRVILDCGNFYPTQGDADSVDAAWTSLVAALNGVGADQIAVLMSVGSVGTTDMRTTVQNATAYAGFSKFAAALKWLGGTPVLVAGPNFNNQDTYALVGWGNAPNALASGAAEASSALPGQVNAGVLQGILQRERTGYFRPVQPSQVLQGLFSAKGGLDSSDFLLTQVSMQQPVEWPSYSSTTLLPGASSMPGQWAAFRFISHWLLAGYYIRGIQGPHQDDIHYFFTGSLNTLIDYHSFDPANLPFPAAGGWAAFGCDSTDGSTCTFQAPGDNIPSSFTVADFNAVKAQLSLEVQYLTNALQFLVTGSTNLKDVVAAGNSNIGLALTAAANKVLGSAFVNQNQQAQLQTTSVSISWQAILGTVSGALSTLANIEGFGELVTPVWDTIKASGMDGQTKGITTFGNMIGALLGTIGSGESVKGQSTSSSPPQPFAEFTTTVGDLATQDLQSPLLLGFDVLVDNITGDYARLKALSDRVIDVNEPAFFAPNQMAQQLAIKALTNAAQTRFYLALMPTVYKVHSWKAINAHNIPTDSFQPTVGSYHKGTNDYCLAFYLSPNQNTATTTLGTLGTYAGVTYWTMGNASSAFQEDEGFHDFYVIDGKVAQGGSNSTNIATIDQDLGLTLFGPDQLNLSMDQFVAENGPMGVANAVVDASTVVSSFVGFGAGSICDASDPDYGATFVGAAPVGGTDSLGRLITTTTLSGALSTSLDDGAATLRATVKADKPVTAGVVYFLVDSQVVGEAKVGADGTATLSVPGLALGKHKITANYGMGLDDYAPSSAGEVTLGVYAGKPGLSIGAARRSLDVSYDGPSAPLALDIASMSGLSGEVSLSCVGLPAGMSCSFDTASTTLGADGTLKASVTIGPTAAQKAGLGLLLMLPLLGVGSRRREPSPQRRWMPLLLVLAASAAALSGCGGDDDAATPRESGSKTILVTATVGTVTSSVPLVLNIK